MAQEQAVHLPTSHPPTECAGLMLSFDLARGSPVGPVILWIRYPGVRRCKGILALAAPAGRKSLHVLGLGQRLQAGWTGLGRPRDRDLSGPDRFQFAPAHVRAPGAYPLP